MTGWNLPPGVNVSDIPGNRPEDEANEVFHEALDERFDKKYPQHKQASTAMIQLVVDHNMDDVFSLYVEMARDMGYNQGYNDGGMDEAMARDLKEQDAES